MSNAIAHRPHVQHRVPLMPVVAVVVAIAIAAIAIYAINQPGTVTTTTVGTETVSIPASTAVVPAPDNQVFRHDLMRMGESGQLRPYLANLRHLVNGALLDPVSARPSSDFQQPDYPRVGQ